MNEARLQDTTNKDVWFSAVKDRGGRIVGLAMAERLSIPGRDMTALDIVESTEWNVLKEFEGNGLMTANVARLNAQILSDLGNDSGRLPLIFAECNFQSHAERVGRGAGLRVPERTFVPQILVQNVSIRDGQPIEDGKLRDFTFMYLSVDLMQRHYDPSQVEAMMQVTRAKSFA